MADARANEVVRGTPVERIGLVWPLTREVASLGKRHNMDIDIWVMPSPDNADGVLRALRRFGTPLHHVTRNDFEKEGTVFQIGVAPRRIDIITAASGLQFEDTYRKSLVVEIEGIQVRIPSVDDLILNKRAAGRTKDLADAEALEELKDSDQANPGDQR